MKRSLLFHVLFVSGTYYLSNVLYVVRGVALAWLLGPAAFGVWSSMRLVQTFSQYAQLGTRQGVVQLAALADGQGDERVAQALRRSASGLALVAAAVVAAGTIAFAAASPTWGGAWLAFAPTLLVVHLTFFYEAILRSHQRYSRAATGEVIVALVSTTVGLAAAWRFGLLGFVVVLGVAQLVTLLALRRGGVPYPTPSFDRAAARRLLACGLPLMSSAALFILLWNVDKLLLWGMRGAEALGIYSVQATFTNAALLAPAAVGTVLHPHLMRELGRQRTPDALRPYLLRGSELIALGSLPIVALGHLLLHLPVRWGLPQYAASITPGQILMLASYASMMATMAAVVVVSLGGQRTLCVIRLLAIAVAGGAGAYGLRHGYTGLAWAMTAAVTLDGVLTMWEACRRAGVTAADALRLLTQLLAPFFALLALLVMAWRTIPDSPASLQADAAATALRCLLVLAILLPWCLWRSHRLRRTQPAAVAAVAPVGSA